MLGEHSVFVGVNLAVNWKLKPVCLWGVCALVLDPGSLFGWNCDVQGFVPVWSHKAFLNMKVHIKVQWPISTLYSQKPRLNDKALSTPVCVPWFCCVFSVPRDSISVRLFY